MPLRGQSGDWKAESLSGAFLTMVMSGASTGQSS